MNPAEVQQELNQRIIALNDETFKIEQKIKTETRELNAVKNQKLNEHKTKSEVIAQLNEIDNELIAKKERTKALDEVISQIEEVQHGRLKEMTQCQDRVRDIEKAMDDRRESKLKALKLFGIGLSEINDKLYYQNIHALFHSKSAEMAQKHIETVALSALETIGCPIDRAMEQFNANKMNISYANTSIQEAMDIDSKTEEKGVNSQKVEQMKAEIKEIEGEIKILKENNAVLMSDREGFEQKHEELQKEMQQKQLQLKQQEMTIGTSSTTSEEDIEKQRKELLKHLNWVKENILVNAQKLVKAFHESNDPKFDDDKPFPYSETGWNVAQVKQYIDMYQARFPEYENLARAISYDILAEDATVNIKETEQTESA
eukprot:243502_1